MVRVYILIAAWLASIAGATYLTQDYVRAKADQGKLDAVRRAIQQQEALDSEVHAIELDAAKAAQDARIEYRTKIKKVIQYVEANPDRVLCFDDNGVRLYNENRTSVEDASGSAVREEPSGP